MEWLLLSLRHNERAQDGKVKKGAIMQVREEQDEKPRRLHQSKYHPFPGPRDHMRTAQLLEMLCIAIIQ